MNCEEFVAFIVDYLEGDLCDDAKQRFEAHLKKCPDSAKYLESYKKCVDLAKLCNCERDIPESVPEHFVQGVLKARKEGGC